MPALPRPSPSSRAQELGASEAPSQISHHSEKPAHRVSYVHFNGLPALCFDRATDPAMLRSIADDPAAAPVVLAEARAMLSWRMAHAERRLTGCQLTPAGVVGRF